MARKSKSEAAVRNGGAKTAGEAPGKKPRNHRELAQAIFEACDPVQLGRQLLESDSDRSSSVKARVWETLVHFAFGKPAPTEPASAPKRIRVIWDMPSPPHERENSQHGSR